MKHEVLGEVDIFIFKDTMFELFLSILIWGVSGAASWWPLGCAGKLRWKGVRGMATQHKRQGWLSAANQQYISANVWFPQCSFFVYFGWNFENIWCRTLQLQEKVMRRGFFSFAFRDAKLLGEPAAHRQQRRGMPSKAGPVISDPLGIGENIPRSKWECSHSHWVWIPIVHFLSNWREDWM